MFIGREKELRQLNAELSSWKRRKAVLVYGKRRVGKSTLLSEAAKSFEGVVINHMCVTSTFEGNMELIYQSVSEGLGLPNIRFGSLFEMTDYLKTKSIPICRRSSTGCPKMSSWYSAVRTSP